MPAPSQSPVSSFPLFCLVNLYSSFRAQLENYFLKKYLFALSHPHFPTYEFDVSYIPLVPIIIKIIMFLFNICSVFSVSHLLLFPQYSVTWHVVFAERMTEACPLNLAISSRCCPW